MSLDGLVVNGLSRELQSCVMGRINKVQMPSNNDIILQIRTAGRTVKLLLSANPTYPRVHLTEQSFINPLEAPMFCMLLRKHCDGGIIEAIEQPGLERVLHFRIRQRDELGDLSVKTVIVEIMGRHSNIILTDPATGIILDGIHHVTPAISSYRVVMPGSTYIAPPEQHKIIPFELNKDQFTQLMTESADAAQAQQEDTASPRFWEQTLVQHLSGFSPLIARELVYRAMGPSFNASTHTVTAERLWEPLRTLTEQVRSGSPDPVIVEQEKTGKTFFSITELTHIPGEVRRYDTVSSCLEAYYGDKAERDTVKQRVSDLIRLISNERNKNVKKLDKLEETLKEARDADKFRILGELLTASMHLIRKGERQIEVINYYDEEQRPVTIELDPLMTPSENAQRYFKKYTKSKNSLIAVKEQMTQAHEEIGYLDSLLQQLASAGLTDIQEIREELTEQGYLRGRGKKGRKKKPNQKPQLSCYTSSEGIPIYVGKNNTQNEYLTNRLAHSGDTWLHTKDIPGSHVVIRNTNYGEATLHEAARLAAYYSQAKESSQVPVDYTLIKHVRKPSGAKPGFVIYDHQKTLFVTPNAEVIKLMPVTVK
ncbi:MULTISPECIES: NFACT RNA binding domain-containing protein [unclassified Paenibacillus]|uniref:Rqc2 family fibronectin-binding protein n=1 Tax=unclassified Paenibacillus TaxID=185978 RepID=UPI001AE5CC44|nr:MULTISPECIES: NFACT RNA binding domain-containing protein [unclassified Paenibacillus]MBP1156104.1 putative ribosome quality control (RQC) complex YloA/Tae2 family protein [Paenibacillus sp. PvP091]MBP1168510.1 putative ribosome quality control (RQC) complex YloA/Tae2 family protein [Paenibacillus sp. PvR098]MBP2439538.1 putative ribosome quality control (RQC) complex YloA/Tae2 family protein [Paenibacillus sp. PvP052]